MTLKCFVIVVISYLILTLHSGVEVVLPDETVIVCKAKVLFAVCDLPAKAAIMNCNQYNGRHGCPCCKHEGRQVCLENVCVVHVFVLVFH